MTEILIGCDPEVFVKQGGIFKSAHNLIRGDKKSPQRVRNGAVQVDGMALEFNIDPAKNEDEFCFNVTDVLSTMSSMVPGYEVVAVPVAHFTREYMDAQPEAAKELGCDPDFNAWSRSVNVKPDGNRPMRTAAGHVHIGWTNNEDVQNLDHVERSNMVVKSLDFFLGLPSLFWDADTERREMYGKSGCCRYKPYGVEYRTLSNAWLKSNALMRLVYRNTVAGTKAAMSGRLLYDVYGDIQEIINNSDTKEALKIIKAERIETIRG
jgi:hypothetical protein